MLQSNRANVHPVDPDWNNWHKLKMCNVYTFSSWFINICAASQLSRQFRHKYIRFVLRLHLVLLYSFCARFEWFECRVHCKVPPNSTFPLHTDHFSTRRNASRKRTEHNITIILFFISHGNWILHHRHITFTLSSSPTLPSSISLMQTHLLTDTVCLSVLDAYICCDAVLALCAYAWVQHRRASYRNSNKSFRE